MAALRRLPPATLLGLLVALALLASGGAAARGTAGASDLVEVVVTLPQAPLTQAVLYDRRLASAHGRHALNVRMPAAVSYLRTLAAAQSAFAARVARKLPDARIRWHYSVALDGVSVVLPRSELWALSRVPGATVWPSATYRELGGTAAHAGRAGASPTALIGATQLWGSDLSTAGEGMKIAILDDGIDQTHPYFDPTGFSYPPGFPKGNRAYTTPKVIVARSYPSPSTTWKYAKTPFDPDYSDHATHVAGIAAGDFNTLANGPTGRVRVSGVAPRAYLGNYKVLTVPTKDWGLDGNAPEIAKGIDQAVADGMNVINLSLGESEVEPSRDIVVKALENAAAAGVVPVVAAGNEGEGSGHGSISSPANTPAAIAVAASSAGGSSGAPDEIADFSSIGPTPISLQLKPDVTAPGESILSSIPHGSWDVWDGTSMATPHVAGAVALLMQRHPTWTVEQVKSALESTGAPVHAPGTQTEVGPAREGGGRINLAAADQPLVFTEPASLSFGLVKRGFVGTKQLLVTDAGGGIAPWSVSIALQVAPAGVTLAPAAPTVVAGSSLGITAAVASTAQEGDASGWIELARGTDVRRVPFWLHVEVPQLPLDPHTLLHGPGLYRGNTAGKPSRVSSYRYPDKGIAAGVATDLSGPEQVFQFTLRKPVANVGAVVLTHDPDMKVSPRLVEADDENRLVGDPGLPTTNNPYTGLERPYPVVGAILPTPGTYDLVFDTPAGAKPGRFLFRFWIDDRTPPRARLLTPMVRVGQPIRFAVSDSGSGVDPGSLDVVRDGSHVPFTYAHGIVSVDTTTLAPGTHRLTLTAADYQETKNNEDVGPVLPNTRVVHVTVAVSP
jgi:subtilisin family serine protease